MPFGTIDRNCLLRVFALVLGFWLIVLPQVANSKSVLMMMDDYGTVPTPLAEEEEVKHACSIERLMTAPPAPPILVDLEVPLLEDPFGQVEHTEVDVPPPKRG